MQLTLTLMRLTLNLFITLHRLLNRYRIKRFFSKNEMDLRMEMGMPLDKEKSKNFYKVLERYTLLSFEWPSVEEFDNWNSAQLKPWKVILAGTTGSLGSFSGQIDHRAVRRNEC